VIGAATYGIKKWRLNRNSSDYEDDGDGDGDGDGGGEDENGLNHDNNQSVTFD